MGPEVPSHQYSRWQHPTLSYSPSAAATIGKLFWSNLVPTKRGQCLLLEAETTISRLCNTHKKRQKEMAAVGVHYRQFVEAPVSPTISRSHHDGLVIDFSGFVERDYAGVRGRS